MSSTETDNFPEYLTHFVGGIQFYNSAAETLFGVKGTKANVETYAHKHAGIHLSFCHGKTLNYF